MTAFLLAGLGAAIGAPVRYLADQAIQNRLRGVFPWGTCTVNAVGSLLLGVAAGLSRQHGLPTDVQVALGTGFCGGLTTFSTFSFEVVRLLEDGSTFEAIATVAANVVLAILAAAAGLAAVSLW